MDFRKIEYFLKAAEKLNFTEAARELFISPQALTQQIAQLEQELNVSLFVRSTRKVSLTEQGSYLYQKFLPVKSAYDTAVADVSAHFTEQADTLRVGFFHGLPKNTLVTPWLNLIQTHLPDKNLEVIASDMSTLWSYLDSDKLDICLSNVDDLFPLGNYQYATFCTVPAQIVISLNHPWALKDAISVADMADADMLQLRVPSSTPYQNFYSQVSCRSIQNVRDFDTLLAYLENGKYFAVFPPVFEFREQAKFKYFSLPKEYVFFYHTLCACRKDTPKLLVKELLNYIQEEWDAYSD